MGEVKKYQHLIPRVYMKQWQSRIEKNTNKNKEVYVYKYDKDKLFETGEEVNTRKIGGIENFYTITKNNLFINDEDMLRISNGETRILDIEDGWKEKLEDSWEHVIKKVHNDILGTNKKSIPEVRKQEIIDFLVCMKYRGFKGLDKVRIYIIQSIWFLRLGENFTEVMMKYYAMDDKYIKNHLLSDMRKFLEKDESSFIYKECKLYKDNTVIVFNIAPEGVEFLTSDNPSFECGVEFLTSNIPSFDCKMIKTKIKGKVHLMPLSPKVLIMILRKNGNKSYEYKINRVDREEVKQINNIIVEESVNFVISSKSSVQDLV